METMVVISITIEITLRLSVLTIPLSPRESLEPLSCRSENLDRLFNGI